MNTGALRGLSGHGVVPSTHSRRTRSNLLPFTVRYQTHSRPEYIPNHIDDPNYVRIFDTTLRDGEQSPGATLTAREKLDIAHQLSKLGVDVIEAGFPISSPDDFEAVRTIAMEVGNEVDEDGYVPVICGMGRTMFKDLERTWDAVRHAKRPRVHMVIATSEIHMQHKLHMTRDQVIENAVAAVKHLQSMGCYDIEFCPEDASRSDPAFLCEVLGEVIKAGATTINVPDTVGWSMPHEYAGLITRIRQNTPGIENVVLSTHCHDDLGLSTANSLAGVMAGARQIEVCVNGIGERAGNASLEQVVMALALKGKDQMDGLRTGIRPVHIYPASRMVSNYSGMIVQPHRAIVGANAFLHECGMHQDGILKHRETYEIMTPETIGLQRSNGATGIVLGKLSGRKALLTRLQQMGVNLEPQQLDIVFKKFKVLADKKKSGITDDDLLSLVRGEDEELAATSAVWELVDLQVVHGTMGVPTCTVSLKGRDLISHVSEGMGGTGPVDAAFKAIDNVVGVEVELVDYSVQSQWEGSAAACSVRVNIQPTGQVKSHAGAKAKRTFSGQGSDEDVVVASAMAYVTALNKLIGWHSVVNRATGEEDEETEQPAVSSNGYAVNGHSKGNGRIPAGSSNGSSNGGRASGQQGVQRGRRTTSGSGMLVSA